MKPGPRTRCSHSGCAVSSARRFCLRHVHLYALDGTPLWTSMMRISHLGCDELVNGILVLQRAARAHADASGKPVEKCRHPLFVPLVRELASRGACCRDGILDGAWCCCPLGTRRRRAMLVRVAVCLAAAILASFWVVWK